MYLCSSSAPTGAVQSVRIFNIQQTDVVIEISPPFDILQDGLITSYNISITDTTTNSTISSVRSLPMPKHPIIEALNFTSFMLSSLTNYFVTVGAVNSAGEGPVSDAVTFITLPFRKLLKYKVIH